ncbi:DUF418 domain-containing protein [Nocardiopsis kunsanensis]|uniref:Transporter n=1 Tax=Nocardiopsis kunsanensis TaxID=141693 RepID=A0A919CKQ5_9ACTN|nr:DUF418 domain-containing protein [Nocardiopsis kunsanensis]GHD31521.1 transporter [Nocardiopsis kunsanensis]
MTVERTPEPAPPVSGAGHERDAAERAGGAAPRTGTPTRPGKPSDTGGAPGTLPAHHSGGDAVRRRLPLLDVARGLAMIGVIAMNATSVVLAAESFGEKPFGTLTSLVDGGLVLLMSGKARALLMVLLGAGAVLAWRSARDRGTRPAAAMVRRYTALGVLFGLPHLAVFSGDILTHYALTALVLTPLMPLLLAGSRKRPLAGSAVLFALAPGAEYLVDLMDLGSWNMQVAPLPQTLGFFCVGVWLARRPELDPRSTDVPTRLPGGFVWIGLATQVLGMAVLFLDDLLYPVRFDPDGVPILPAGSQMLVSFSGTLSGLGGALFFLGLAWWLLRRDRFAARALRCLAPLGRVTLTVYLASTAFFLLTMGPFEARIPILGQYGIALVLLAAALLFAHLWQRAFRTGPLEWVWRSLAHMRPLPLRRVHRP